jgi:VRR-NUC domain-containing protein
MGLRGPLPDHILEKVDKTQRPPGKAGKTTKELAQWKEFDLEKAHHRIFWNYCLLKDITTDYHNPTRKTTNKKGWPDFPCYKNGRVLFVEFKSPTGKLTKEQLEVRAELERQGFKYVVVYAASDAIEIADSYLIQRQS